MTRQPNLFGHQPGRNLLPEAAEAFDRFWAAYPVREHSNPRRLAEAEFAALVRSGFEPEVLVQAAKRYAAHCQAKAIGPTFRYEARNFLGRGVWHDFAEPAADPLPPPPVKDGVIAGHFLAALGRHMDPVQWRMWIAPLRLHRRDSVHQAIVAAPGRFHAAKVSTDHNARIKHLLGVARVDILAQEDIHD